MDQALHRCVLYQGWPQSICNWFLQVPSAAQDPLFVVKSEKASSSAPDYREDLRPALRVSLVFPRDAPFQKRGQIVRYQTQPGQLRKEDSESPFRAFDTVW